MIHMSDGYPATDSPHINVLAMITSMYMNATIEIIKPNIDDMRNGVTEYDVTPSIA